MKKAIKIDVETKSVYYVELGESYTDIYPQIGNGCSTFCVPFTFPKNDTMFADDESLLRYDDIKGGFVFHDWDTPIVGNAIILGTDDEGNSIDCLTDIEEIRNQVTFVNEDICKRWANQVMSTPREVIMF